MVELRKIYFFNDMRDSKGVRFSKSKSYPIIEEDGHFYWLEDDHGNLISICKETCNLAYSIEEDLYEETFY